MVRWGTSCVLVSLCYVTMCLRVGFDQLLVKIKINLFILLQSKLNISYIYRYIYYQLQFNSFY